MRPLESSRSLSLPDAHDCGVFDAPIESTTGLSEPLARSRGSTGVSAVEQRVEQALEALDRGEIEEAYDGLDAVLSALRADRRS